MELGFVLLGLVGLAGVLLVMLGVIKSVSERESDRRRKDAARHKQKRAVPFFGDTVTHS